MIRDGSKPWLRAAATVVCGMVAATFSSFLSLAHADVCPCSSNTCTDNSFDFGAVEYKAPPLQSEAYVFYSCGNTAVSEITSSDPNDFTISYPSKLPGPSCNGFAWNSGNQGQKCWFQINFAPQGTGPYNSTVTVSVTNGIGASAFPNFGAGFTLSPENHDENTSGQTVDAFPLMYESPPSAGFGSITFDPGNAVIEFSGVLDYQTSGKVPKKPARIPIAAFTANGAPYTVGFGTPGAAPTPNAPYQIAGGQLTLNATYNAGAPHDPWTNTTKGYVTGVPTSPSPGINYAAIASQLNALYPSVAYSYSDPSFPVTGLMTPGLMEQVAMQESGLYQQFFTPTKTTKAPYGIIDSWPLESAPNSKSHAGSHIGLMQVPVSQVDAWNWLQNTTDGVGIFKTGPTGKLQVAYSLADQMRTGYTVNGQATSLPDLTACELEEMALELYGPSAHAQDVTRQYYLQTCVNGTANGTNCTGSNASWQWTINTSKKNYCGVCYVAGVRKQVPLSGALSTTSCPVPGPPSPISADPPNLTNCTKICTSKK